MKKLILTTLVLTLLLTSCTGKSQNNSDFTIVMPHQSVYNDILITVSGGTLYYTDLLENITMPVCVRPNCSHKEGSESCTARGRADQMGGFSAPFIHGENLYFFFSMDDDLVFYKSNLDGGNRQKIFSYNQPEDTDDIIHFVGSVSGVIYDDEKLYFLIVQGTLKIVPAGLASTGVNKFTIYCYDLISDKCEIVYETDYLSQSWWQLNHSIQYRKYIDDDRFDDMEQKEFNEQLLNPDSDYHKSTINENGYFDTSSHEWVIINNIPRAYVNIIADYGYYLVDNNLYKQHLQTHEKEIIFYDVK
ncbi:MAG: hypothetical protein FWD34_06710, partial [Oscillospiraceae bacterium]|nr:hypothetical protein [Oscillospiraceae bacterium]